MLKRHLSDSGDSGCLVAMMSEKATSVRANWRMWMGTALLLGVAGGACGAWLQRVDRLAPWLPGFTAQAGDRPLAREFDPAIGGRLSVWQRAELPMVQQWRAPMGAENGAWTYIAQGFWEWNEQRGGHHLGEDWNGIGGMDSDLGDEIYAVADALVLYSGQPSEGWGLVVILGHRLPDGTILQSMYAHMLDCCVAVGDLVARGAMIGHVGTADGLYPAHLHFEMREGELLNMGPGYANETNNRILPLAIPPRKP